MLYHFLPEPEVLLLKPRLQVSQGQMCFNPGQNLLGLKRFADIINATQGKGFQFVHGLVQTTDKNNGYVACPVICFQFLANFITGHAGHHDIKQNQIRQFFLYGSQSLTAIEHWPDFVLLTAQDPA